MKQFKVAKNILTDKWELTEEASGDVLKTFRTRDQALGRRVIERAIENHGQVVVYRVDGTISKTLVYPVRERR